MEPISSLHKIGDSKAKKEPKTFLVGDACMFEKCRCKKGEDIYTSKLSAQSLEDQTALSLSFGTGNTH